MNDADHEKGRCDECGSAFFRDASAMEGLCSECAHLLYGYEPCLHSMVSGACIHCGWDGSSTPYTDGLRASRSKG